jgi:hypothetical protein
MDYIEAGFIVATMGGAALFPQVPKVLKMYKRYFS